MIKKKQRFTFQVSQELTEKLSQLSNEHHFYFAKYTLYK